MWHPLLSIPTYDRDESLMTKNPAHAHSLWKQPTPFPFHSPSLTSSPTDTHLLNSKRLQGLTIRVARSSSSLSQADPLTLSPRPPILWLPSERRQPSPGSPVASSLPSPFLSYCPHSHLDSCCEILPTWSQEPTNRLALGLPAQGQFLCLFTV